MEYRFDGDNNLYERGEREFSAPARVKQMGGIENGIKIFMEDYVYTYLYQYGRSGGGKEKLAALIGRHYIVNGQETVVISGAIQGKDTVQEGGVERFRRAAEALGGTPVQAGDAAYDFAFVDDVIVRLILWEGDDEYPTTSQILFSDNTPLAFAAEELAAVGDVLLGSLKRA